MKKHKTGKHKTRTRSWAKPLSSEQLKKQSEEAKEGSKASGSRRSFIKEDIPRYVLHEGNNYMRVIPPIEKEELGHFGLRVPVHKNMGGPEFICYDRFKGEPCPRCKRQQLMWDEDRELAKRMYPSDRTLIWVQDLLSEEDEEAPLLWDCPISVERDILKQCEKTKRGKSLGEFIDPSDPENGRCIQFKYIAPVRKGRNNTPGQYEAITLDQEEPAPKLDPSILDKITPLEDCLNHHEYDEFEKFDSGKPGEQKSKNASKEADEEATDEYDGLDLPSMSRDELKGLIKERDLDITVKKSMSDDDIRALIAEELGIEVDADEPEDEEDEPEEEDDELEDEDDEEENDDFDDMSRSELKAYIRKNDLNVKVTTAMSDDDIREEIREIEVGEKELSKQRDRVRSKVDKMLGKNKKRGK